MKKTTTVRRTDAQFFFGFWHFMMCGFFVYRTGSNSFSAQKQGQCEAKRSTFEKRPSNNRFNTLRHCRATCCCCWSQHHWFSGSARLCGFVAQKGQTTRRRVWLVQSRGVWQTSVRQLRLQSVRRLCAKASGQRRSLQRRKSERCECWSHTGLCGAGLLLSANNE